MCRFLVYAALAAVLIIFVASCGDDDCPECPTLPTTPSLYAIGNITKDDYRLNVYVELFDIGSAGADIDSVFVDGENTWCCIREQSHSSANDGRQIIANFGSTTCPSGLIVEFTANDTTELVIYTQSEAHRVRLHLMDTPGSMPTGLTASVVAEADEIEISWNAVADADWYSVRMKSRPLATPVHNWSYASVTATTVILPLFFGPTFTHDVDIYVAAATGPMPTEQNPVTNISGPYISGTIYSVSDDRHINQILNPLIGAEPVTAESLPVPSFVEQIKISGSHPVLSGS